MIRSTKIRRALFLVFLSVFATTGSRPQTPQQTLKKLLSPELHVLFIGNSFIYFNNMPHIVEAISESLDGPRIKTEMVAIGGARLEDLWKQGSALAAIRKQHWDFVVMNEQSALGGGKVNGEKRIGDPADFFKYAEMFDTEIRRAGGKTVILMTWKDENDPDRIQADLNNAFFEFERKMAGAVILCPVSAAWTSTVKTAPEINLYFGDGHHPSHEGSYLVACTVYAVLANHSPVGAVAKVEGAQVEEENGIVHSDKIKVLVNISPRIANKLQEIALKAAPEIREFSIQ
ncbi:MAG TPA: SGNH/GDSL hydrolase family protein [Candidatus Acidoferrales bacterium]|jgi:hypothetical protein